MQQKPKTFQELPDELVAEISTLYDMGVDAYELDYLISLRTKNRV